MPLGETQAVVRRENGDIGSQKYPGKTQSEEVPSPRTASYPIAFDITEGLQFGRLFLCLRARSMLVDCSGSSVYAAVHKIYEGRSLTNALHLNVRLA